MTLSLKMPKALSRTLVVLKCMLDRRTPTELLRIASEHRTEYAQQYVHVESLSSVVLCSFKL